MKKLLRAIVAMAALFFIGCGTDNFEPEFLHSGSGLWMSTLQIGGKDNITYERFAADGSGKTWSTTDGMTESDAQLFKWTLEGSSLRYLHRDDNSGQYSIPENFTVLELNATTLRKKGTDGEVVTARKQ